MVNVNQQKTNWEAELADAINRNRLALESFDDDTIKKVTKIYDQVVQNIVNEINISFQKANDDGKWNKSKAIKFNRNTRLVNSIRNNIRISNASLKSITRSQIKKTASKEFIEVQKILNDFQLLKKAYAPNVREFQKFVLAQDVQGLTYLERQNKISTAEALQIEEQIKLSQTLGEGFNQTVARVRKISNLGKESTIRLVSTTMMTASNLAHFKQYERTGVVAQWRWSSALDDRVCPICGPKDGRIYSMEEQSIIPAHFRCRCSPIAVITSKLFKKLGLPEMEVQSDRTRIARDPITGKNYKVPATTNWKDWVSDQPANIQREILGAGKYKLWKQNKIELNELSIGRYIVPLRTFKKSKR